MRAYLLLGVVVLTASAVWAADKIQPLDVKLGLWQVSSTNETTGMPPIPPDVLARMTPEQKAKMEAEMQAQRGPHTQTRKHCLKKEDLEKGTTFGENRKNCTRTVVNSSSRKMEVRLQCQEGDGAKSDMTLNIDALSAENVKGLIQGDVSGSGHTMHIKSAFTAKWLGPVCGKTTD